jgi:K+-sensing histidine kinase KdpD
MFNLKNAEVPIVTSNNNRILASVSHDLRNPLSAIIYAIDFLIEGNNDNFDEESNFIAKSIKYSAKEALDMVNDLMDVTQANSGKFNVNLDHKIDIGEVIERSIQLTKHLYYNKKIQIETNIENDISLINLDQKRMKQILVNIISNSIKYSEENTKITINARLYNNFLEILIKDQGFGMCPEELQIALSDYGVIDGRRIDSFGLGIPLIKHLVEIQKGIIDIKSEKSIGTEFFIRFPI